MLDKIRKMLARDVTIIIGFALFLWVTMCFIMLRILEAVGYSHTRSIIIGIGVVTLFFASLSLAVLIAHLRKNRQEVYTEEILHSSPVLDEAEESLPGEQDPPVSVHAPKAESGVFVKVFDIMFVMALCFVTLLATMLMRGKTVNNADIYAVEIVSALVTVIGFTVYFVSVLASSDKELKLMVDELYSDGDVSEK